MILLPKSLGINLFLHSYAQADWLGRAIFLSLIALSIITWTLIIYKVQVTRRVRQKSAHFRGLFEKSRHHPLGIQVDAIDASPFARLYQTLRQFTVDLLTKNREFGQVQGQEQAYLSPSDIELVETQVNSSISSEAQGLSSSLYILATIVTLAPFLGLLGTVWGILTTFSDPSMISGGAGSEAVLGGMSLALVTTVLGLIDAIPALIGYNYLKNVIGSFETEMEVFSGQVLGSVELQYRQVDLRDHRIEAHNEAT